MTSEVAVHEVGHDLVGLKTERKPLQAWVQGGEGSVDFEAFPGTPRAAFEEGLSFRPVAIPYTRDIDCLLRQSREWPRSEVSI